VGLDTTDSEIDAGLYGEPPPGEPFLILGHEALGIVEASAGTPALAPGDYVVPTVRRPDDCINCRAGEMDMCLLGGYRERGIRGLHGFLCERFVEEPRYLVKVPPGLVPLAVLLEPLSIVEKAVEQCFFVQRRMVWQPTTALVLGAGPIGLLASLLLRLRGIDTSVFAANPADSLQAELARAIGARYLDAASWDIAALPEQMGNIDIIIEATGNSTVAFQAMSILGTNGVMCLTGVYGGHAQLTVEADVLNLKMVLGNKLLFGSVNAGRRHFEQGLEDLQAARARWPGLLERFITRTVPLEEFRLGLERSPDDVKVVVQLAP